MSNEQINKNLCTNFIPPNNDIKFNDINNINNNLNHIILNNNNTFLNDNNSINFFQNTLNNIIQLNNIYNDFYSNNYINYNNNINDGFLLNNLLINNASFPFINILSMMNLFNSLNYQKWATPTIEYNSNNYIGLKELNNKNVKNFLLNKNNNLSNDNINKQIYSLKFNKINLI